MKKSSLVAFNVALCVCFIGLGVLSYAIIQERAQRKVEYVKIMGNVESFKTVSNEVLLYKKILDIWFENGREYMDDDTLRNLALLTYTYHQKYNGETGEIPIGLEYWKIFAWIDVESNFDPTVESYAGAMGLTQHMYITAIDGLDRYFGLKGLSKKQVLEYVDDPIWNFRLGIRRLVDYQLKFIAGGVASKDDWKLTFSLYQWSTMAVSNLMVAVNSDTPKASLKYAISIEKKLKEFM